MRLFALLLCFSLMSSWAKAQLCDGQAVLAEQSLDFLSKSVDLVACNVQITKTDRYSIEGCQKYIACYNSRTTPSTRTQSVILTEVARRHGDALLTKDLKDEFLKYEILKASIEKFEDNPKEFKLCPSKFEIQGNDECDPKLMDSIISPEKVSEYKKQSEDLVASRSREFAQLKEYLRKIPKGTPEEIAKKAIEIYKSNDQMKNVVDPFIEIFEMEQKKQMVTSQSFIELVQNLNNEAPSSSKRDELLKTFFTEEKKFMVEDACTVSKSSNQGSMQKICNSVTAIAKGEKTRYSLDANGLSGLYAYENEDDLDVSYQRCISFGISDVATTGLLQAIADEGAIVTPPPRSPRLSASSAEGSSSTSGFAEWAPVESADAETVMDPGTAKGISTPATEQQQTAIEAPKPSEEIAPNQPSSFVNNSTNDHMYGVHPMAVDSEGVPIPPPSLIPAGPTSSSRNTSSHFGQSLASEVDALQEKLKAAEGKLDKLNAEIEARKTEEEKRIHQKELDELKKEIEKLKAEKIAASANMIKAQTPSTSSSNVATLIPSPQAYTGQSIQQEEARNSASLTPVSQSKGSSAIKNKEGIASKSDSSSGSSALQLSIREEIIDYPNVDLLKSSEDPFILARVIASADTKPFYIQDKNKIVWTIIPLVDEKTKKVISYQAIRKNKTVAKSGKEQKKEPARVPASVKVSEPPKREFYLKDLKKLIKTP